MVALRPFMDVERAELDGLTGNTAGRREKLAQAHKSCDELVQKLCAAVGPDSQSCQLVTNETKKFPPDKCKMMMEHLPEHFVGYLKFREAVYRTPEQGAHLPVKTKELLYTVLDIVTGNLDGAKNHAQAGVTAGMTSGELAEACMQVMHVCGVTTWGKTGYKVVDYVAGLEKANGAA